MDLKRGSAWWTGSWPICLHFSKSKQTNKRREIQNSNSLQIEESLASINQGILFDMHGQAHGQNSTEFGYTLPFQALEAASHNGAEINSTSSIDFLVRRSGLSLKSLVMGEKSLGTFLDNQGFDGLPSKNRPKPNTTYKYYRVSI